MRKLACTAVLAVFVLALPATARAEFLPGADLVSVSPQRQEQTDAITEAVDISQDGRFVAFQTRARNLFPDTYQDPPGHYRRGAVFRRDLVSGALDLVAFGDLVDAATNSTVRNGAKNPSIGANGRYISFSSAEQLVPADTNTRLDVYVRDMDQPIDSPAAFELVSARDRSEQPATYGGPPTAVTGAQVTVDSAISADGRKVVFGTQAVSDLPAEALATTPSRQLFVRDLDAHTTTLVTSNKLDGTPAGGASSAALASLSADGSSVAWPGANAALQTRLQPGESESDVYYLWRRIGDGPSAPTRRITGVSDVDDPACPESEPIDTGNPTAIGPCYGPLSIPEAGPFTGIIDDRLPTLSADGARVAFQVAGPPRPIGGSGNQLDVFVTDMTIGLTRKEATVELTREFVSLVVDHIEPVKISADGRTIAFVSTRTDFGLPTPRLISPPSADQKKELYVVHLDRMEIERVSTAWDGTQIDRAVASGFGSVSISGDGSRVAFVSTATNLFPGDANELDDAFVASEARDGGAGSGPQEPPFGDVTPREDTEQAGGPALPVSLRHGPGGTVRVTVKAPQAGTLALTARARVNTSRRARLLPIAKARKRVRRPGRVTIVLKPKGRYRRYVRRDGRLRSRLEIRFSPAGGGRVLVARRTVSFTS